MAEADELSRGTMGGAPRNGHQQGYFLGTNGRGGAEVRRASARSRDTSEREENIAGGRLSRESRVESQRRARCVEELG